MSKKQRIAGIDAARGLALFGMFAVHTLWDYNDAGDPSRTTMIAGGRSAAMFAVLAGVSFALMSGANNRLTGEDRKVATVGLIARAITIGIIGLLIGLVINNVGVHYAGVIAFYGLALLLAVPVTWLSIRTVVIVACALATISPVIIYFIRDDVPYDIVGDPQITDLVLHPYGLLTHLLFTGPYPVIALLAYVCAGIAIGRLDLTSQRVAGWLVGIGTAIASVAWIVSSVLLFKFGGLDRLYAVNETDLPNEVTRQTVLWDAQENSATLWDLAQRAPHAYTLFSIAHSIGCAMAILGILLLITRSNIVTTILKPLRAAGSMPLTIYVLQIPMLALWWWNIDPVLWYEGMILFSLVFATTWQYFLGQGPLERIAAFTAREAKRIYKSSVSSVTI